MGESVFVTKYVSGQSIEWPLQDGTVKRIARREYTYTITSKDSGVNIRGQQRGVISIGSKNKGGNSKPQHNRVPLYAA